MDLSTMPRMTFICVFSEFSWHVLIWFYNNVGNSCLLFVGQSQFASALCMTVVFLYTI